MFSFTIHWPANQKERVNVDLGLESVRKVELTTLKTTQWDAKTKKYLLI
jgi:hypothetical protein